MGGGGRAEKKKEKTECRVEGESELTQEYTVGVWEKWAGVPDPQVIKWQVDLQLLRPATPDIPI
jgi:hypothetical protein